MKAEQVKALVTKLITRTTNNEIEWHSLSELQEDNSLQQTFIREIHEEVHFNEYRHLLMGASSFFLHKDGIVALVEVDNESGRDGSHSSEYILVIKVSSRHPLDISDYSGMQYDFYVLGLAIKDYYYKGISLPDDLYEFMHSV